MAVPDDMDDAQQYPKARGIVQLRLHIRWSGPPILYDLGRREDRARVYEQVLREGTDDDIRWYIDQTSFSTSGGTLSFHPKYARPVQSGFAVTGASRLHVDAHYRSGSPGSSRH